MAASSDGTLYLTGRDSWGGVWVCRYEPATSTISWIFIGGIIKGAPAIVAAPDEFVYIAARDPSDSLWTGRLEQVVWQGWYPIGGVTQDDPKLAVESQSLLLMIRDYNRGVWTCAYNVGADYCNSWRYTGGIVSDADIVGMNGDFHIIAREQNAGWWYRYSTNQWTAQNQITGVVSASNVTVTVIDIGPGCYPQAYYWSAIMRDAYSWEALAKTFAQSECVPAGWTNKVSAVVYRDGVAIDSGSYGPLSGDAVAEYRYTLPVNSSAPATIRSQLRLGCNSDAPSQPELLYIPELRAGIKRISHMVQGSADRMSVRK